MLCAARWSEQTRQSPFWILAFACTVALNCQNTSQNACHGCEKRKNSHSIRIFLWWTKISEVMCKHDWHNVRSYLFFNVRTFWTKISDSVCNDLFTKNITFFVVVEKQKSKAAQITKSNVMHYFPKSNWVMHLHFCISISTKTLLCVITSGEKQCRHWTRINFIFQPEAYSFHFWYERSLQLPKIYIFKLLEKNK